MIRSNLLLLSENLCNKVDLFGNNEPISFINELSLIEKWETENSKETNLSLFDRAVVSSSISLSTILWLVQSISKTSNWEADLNYSENFWKYSDSIETLTSNKLYKLVVS